VTSLLAQSLLFYGRRRFRLLYIHNCK